MQKHIIYTFHIEGMHCKSCSLVIERELSDLSYVEKVKMNFNNKTVSVTGDFEGVPQEELAKDFTVLFSEQGYSFSIEKKQTIKDWSDFKIAIPVALGFVVLFVLLQKIGLVNLVDTSTMSYGTVALVGVVASLSSCAAVIGGLLLSMSATFAKEGDRLKPQILFHIGRIISFFVFGGVIGVVGSMFTLNVGVSFVLGIIISLVMLVLGVNLLDVFDFTKKFQPTMPKTISKRMLGVTKINHIATPFLVGVVTFFLPCGFTQSMQVYTLSVGNFLSGGLTMLAFALGTLPVLALISLSSFSIKNNSKSGIFFKSAGLIVIIFALFSIINSLVVVGLISPIFSF